METIKTNSWRSGLMKRGLAVQRKKNELFKKLADAIQEDNIDKQPLISLVKCLKNIMKKKKKKFQEILNKHEENVMSIINDKICSID